MNRFTKNSVSRLGTKQNSLRQIDNIVNKQKFEDIKHLDAVIVSPIEVVEMVEMVEMVKQSIELAEKQTPKMDDYWIQPKLKKIRSKLIKIQI